MSLMGSLGDRTQLREEFEPEGMSIVLKLKSQETEKKKSRREYPRTVGHLQKVQYTGNGNTRKRRKRGRKRRNI